MPSAGNSRNGALTVIDGRTGESFDLAVADGAIRASQLRQIRTSDDDTGLLSYDPALRSTASCRSAVTYIDGERGVLQYRGYPVNQLAAGSSYLEVAYLLIHGELPTPAQLEEWIELIRMHTFVHENVKRFMHGFRHDAHPMGMLLGSVGALSTFYPEARDVDDRAGRRVQAIRLLAKMPTLAAFAYRHNAGQPYVYPDNELSYAGNLLSMLYKMTELKYEPDPRLERALDILFIAHADHEQTCSTTAVRSVGSSRVDPYSALAAGIAALYGPLHGGAAEAVLAMLERIGSIHNVAAFVAGVGDGSSELRGFGHNVYVSHDPRIPIVREAAAEVFAVTGTSRLIEIALELERVAFSDHYFVECQLYPNIDFYSALIYHALGLPPAMFGVMLAIPRASGWIAHWLEMVDDPEQQLARPKQIYTGRRDLRYRSISER
jgi:citrate synthase